MTVDREQVIVTGQELEPVYMGETYAFVTLLDP